MLTNRVQPGFIVLTTTVLIGIILLLTTVMVSFAALVERQTVRLYNEKQAFYLAEAGIDRAIHQLRIKLDYRAEQLTLSPGVIDITVVRTGSVDRFITSIGRVPDRTNPRATKRLRVKVLGDPNHPGTFTVAIQAGTGGFTAVANRNPTIDGSVYSNANIELLGNGARIQGDATAVGTVTNNGTITGTITQMAPPRAFPSVSVEYWRSQASRGLTHTGDFVVSTNSPVTLGAPANIGVITGRLLISSNAQITITGPLWIQGSAGNSVEISGNPHIKLDDNFTGTENVILGDGRFIFSGNAQFESDDDAVMLLMSLHPGTDNPTQIAFDLNANVHFDGVGLFAPNGQIRVGNSTSGLSVTALAAGRILIESNAHIDFDEAFLNANFTGGPIGPYTLSFPSYEEITQ